MKIIISMLIILLAFGCSNKSNDPTAYLTTTNETFNIKCYSGGIVVQSVVADYVFSRDGTNTFVAYLGDRYVGTYSHDVCFCLNKATELPQVE